MHSDQGVRSYCRQLWRRWKSCAIGCCLINLGMGADLGSVVVGTVVDCFDGVVWMDAAK